MAADRGRRRGCRCRTAEPPGRRPAGSWSSGPPSWAAPVASLDADFFAYGGGSLAAAQLVSALRVRYPTITVADIYATPRIGALIDTARQSLPEAWPPGPPRNGPSGPPPCKSQVFQTLMGIPLHILVGMRWLTYLMAANNLLSALRRLHAPPPPFPGGGWRASWLVFVSPAGRMPSRLPLPASCCATWCPERTRAPAGSTCGCGWPSRSRTSPAPSAWPAPRGCRTTPGRSGAKIGNNVQLHSLPPVTGLLSLGSGCNIEPEVDLSGWWIDGDVVHIGAIHIGAGATVGARSTLMPGATHRRRRPGGTGLGRAGQGQGRASSSPGPPPSAGARPSTPGRTPRRTSR